MNTRAPASRFTVRFALLAMVALAVPATGQVHYFTDGWPWTAQTSSGPDAGVSGWYYNLGITGIRIQLVGNAPNDMVVRHVFPGSPAQGLVSVGDHIVGAGGQDFVEPHQNGYGVNVFGAQGPVSEFAVALEAAQSSAGTGQLALHLSSHGSLHDVVLDVGQAYGAFSPTYPDNCPKSELIRVELLDYLVQHQSANGSWGNPVNDLWASLALIADGGQTQLDAARSCAQYLADTTAPTTSEWLPNWRYMSAGIVLAEFYLATGERWVLPELVEVQEFLYFSQYTHPDQIDPEAAITHPGSFPTHDLDSLGGWGHNPGFEGYGPIGMLTGEGALVYSLMSRCGLVIDWWRHDRAYEFLARGTGPNGYLWYSDEVASNTSWADQGRTGAAAVANWFVPPISGQRFSSSVAGWFQPQFGKKYRSRALKQIEQIGSHPQTFPDTHGSPILGMGFTAAAAHLVPDSFRSLMDANRFWFALSQCTDGSFYYQPNRDNAGYGADSRISASAVTAFIFSMPMKSLVITGKS